MFRVHENGFQITFENGYEVSVAFGEVNYCSNRRSGLYVRGECVNAEIAIFKPNGVILSGFFESDDVEGWVSPERVTEVLGIVSNFPSPEEAVLLDRIDKYFDLTEEEYWQLEIENTLDDLEGDWVQN